MANLNKVMLIGRCGQHPKTGRTASGDAWASVSIATSEYYKDKNGEKQEQTEWHNLMFYRRLGEIAEQYIRKGMLIYVEGKIRTNKFTGEDGTERQNSQIIVDKMEMLSSGEKSQSGGNDRPARQNELSDDIPF